MRAPKMPIMGSFNRFRKLIVIKGKTLNEWGKFQARFGNMSDKLEAILNIGP
jgi:hypothetical protein